MIIRIIFLLILFGYVIVYIIYPLLKWLFYSKVKERKEKLLEKKKALNELKEEMVIDEEIKKVENETILILDKKKGHLIQEEGRELEI